MVLFEDVSGLSETELTQQHHQQEPNQSFPFLFSSLIWSIVVLFGLILTGVVAFADLEQIQKPMIARLFFGLFIGNQPMLQIVFIAAIFIHFLEASLVAFLLPSNVSSLVRHSWTIQTFLIGYPSLTLFLQTYGRYLMAHDNKKHH